MTTHWANGIFDRPFVNAFLVKNMIMIAFQLDDSVAAFVCVEANTAFCCAVGGTLLTFGCLLH